MKYNNIGSVVGFCKYSNDSSDTIKSEEFLEQLGENQFDKKGSASWSWSCECKQVFRGHKWPMG